MAAAHTPGPWFADKIADRAAFNIFPAGATFALLTVAPPEHDSAGPVGLAVEANARLIAAAPDMLGALQAICDQSDRIRAANGVPRSPETQALYERARAAIAKATGAAS